MLSYAMRFCIVFCVSLSLADADSTDTCDSVQADQLQSKALLQVKSAQSSIMQPVIGDNQPLGQTEYEELAKKCCGEEMMIFIKKVIDENLGLVICHPGALPGFTLWYDCWDDNQTYAIMEEELIKAKTDDCPWLADSEDKCLIGNCKSYPAATFPPCTTTTTTGTGSSSTTSPTEPPPSTTTTLAPTEPPTTTTLAPTEPPTTTTLAPTEPPTTPTTTTLAPTEPPTTPTTTTNLGSCLTKDIFVAIDASRSVVNGDSDAGRPEDPNGWIKQTKFANFLVAKLVGNANGNRFNIHWFNDVTYPVTGAEGIYAPGNKHSRVQDGFPDANDIGTWVGADFKFDELFDDLEKAYKNEENPSQSIKKHDTDHPQVFLTAKESFSNLSPPASRPTLVLITDGVTHSGNDCKKGQNPRIQELVSKCEKDQGVCYHKDSTMTQAAMCKNSKCACGVFRAEEFKADLAEFDVVVVGVENQHHDQLFTNVMKAMAKDNQFYKVDIAKDEDKLKKIANDIGEYLCYS